MIENKLSVMEGGDSIYFVPKLKKKNSYNDMYLRINDDSYL